MSFVEHIIKVKSRQPMCSRGKFVERLGAVEEKLFYSEKQKCYIVH